jgi:hypothetical protein
VGMLLVNAAPPLFHILHDQMDCIKWTMLQKLTDTNQFS